MMAGTKECLLLRKLYFCPAARKQPAHSLLEIVKAIDKDYGGHTQQFVQHMAQRGVIFRTVEGFLVDRERVMKLLENDVIFVHDVKIVENEGTLLTSVDVNEDLFNNGETYNDEY
jgi:hypothetical protein